eukprot:GHVQ01016176.1.p1 GENE.GHVQ01016176.1~~GHVQ01016176.1.p1  ORF type:complete len:233 (-),score=18.76 GHVQ01016176.1:102-800(-)
MSVELIITFVLSGILCRYMRSRLPADYQPTDEAQFGVKLWLISEPAEATVALHLWDIPSSYWPCYNQTTRQISVTKSEQWSTVLAGVDLIFVCVDGQSHDVLDKVKNWITILRASSLTEQPTGDHSTCGTVQPFDDPLDDAGFSAPRKHAAIGIMITKSDLLKLSDRVALEASLELFTAEQEFAGISWCLVSSKLQSGIHGRGDFIKHEVAKVLMQRMNRHQSFELSEITYS